MKEPQKKDTSILIRLTSDEKETIRKAAVKDKVTVSEYIRGKLFETKQDTKQDAKQDTFDISHTVNHIETLKSQVSYLQEQNVSLQKQNKVYQSEQLDLLQRLLLLSTQQAEKIELIEHEETKKSFWQRFIGK